MRQLSRFLLVAALLSTAACQTPDAPADANTASGTPVQLAGMEDARAEIRAVNDLWQEYQNAGNLEALIGLYVEDAIVVGPEQTRHGRAEILAEMQENYDPEATGSLTSDRIEIAASGDMAFLYGTWSSTSGYSGTYASVLTRRDGQWMWLSDAYNVLTTPED